MKVKPTYEEFNKDFENGKQGADKEIYTMLGKVGHINHLADEWKYLLYVLCDDELKEKYGIYTIQDVIEYMEFREKEVCANYCDVLPSTQQ